MERLYAAGLFFVTAAPQDRHHTVPFTVGDRVQEIGRVGYAVGRKCNFTGKQGYFALPRIALQKLHSDGLLLATKHLAPPLPKNQFRGFTRETGVRGLTGIPTEMTIPPPPARREVPQAHATVGERHEEEEGAT